MKNDYIYAAARIRVLETGLLKRQDLDQLMGARDVSQALLWLAELGWGPRDRTMAPETLLKDQEERTWALVNELLPDPSVLDPLKYQYDYHNLKAAIKLCYTGSSLPKERFFISGGAIPWEKIDQCIREKDYDALPEPMAKAAGEAFETLLHTGDGQLSDSIIDRHFLEDFDRTCQESPARVLRAYGEAFTVFSDLRIALRSYKTQRPISFLNQALAKSKAINIRDLAQEAIKGPEHIAQVAERTKFSSAGPAIRASEAAFEKWCSDTTMALIRPERADSSTLGPVIAYVLARENEIKYVRLILSVKQNQLPETLILERLGELYV